MIKAIFFDYGGVLSQGGQSVGRDIADILNIPHKELRFKDLHELFRRGKISSKEFFDTINMRHNGDGTLQEKLLNRPNFYQKQKKLYDMADTLRSYGIKTAILSNVYEPAATLLRQKGLYDGFDPVLLSCEVGFAKPDREFYQLAIDSVGLVAGECLLIDDQDKCIEPASLFGLKTIKFVNIDQTLKDIRALLLRENSIEI